MDSSQWVRAKEIFEAALELSGDARQQFLLHASSGNSELHRQVEDLLRADAAVESASFMDSGWLLNAFEQAGAIPQTVLHAGDCVASRYEILRQLGEGGMGHVFEAFDRELSISVALKVIRPEIASYPEAVARFRQEVRLARSITHPNVCRIFDIDRGTVISAGKPLEFVFLTMEFLVGETLDSRIRREGPLPPEQALMLARQIGAALDAAHAVGIIHRDMKPANIMLVPGAEEDQLRAVVMDFGLARPAPSYQAGVTAGVTKSAQILGTLAYMSPEQLEGGDVSSATDIYSFGLVLFEMIAGRRVFTSSNPLSGITQRLRDSPVLDNLLPREVPTGWRYALRQCLAISPSVRPKDASAVIRILEKGHVTFSWKLRDLMAPIRRRPKWAAAIMGSAVIVMALFVIIPRLLLTNKEIAVAPGALVYMAPVSNRTGDGHLDNVTQLVQAGLGQSAQINLLDQGRAGDILQQMKKDPVTTIDGPVGREIAMRAGAARVVFVTVSGSKGSYLLDVDLQQPDNTPSRYRRHWSRRFAWKAEVPVSRSDAIPAELLSSVRDASNWIRHEVGESANDIASLDTPPEDVTTGSWQALEEFANAERLHASGKKDEAVWAYRNSVQLDPGFSMAYARLGDELASLSRPLEAYQAYRTALSTDAGQRLSRKERDFIQGSYASDTRDYATALAAFRDYSNFYPNDYRAWFYQAFPLDMLERPQEAIRVLLRADELSPQKHAEASELSYNYLLIGDYTNLKKWIQTIREAGRPDQATLVWALDRFVEARYDESARAFLLLENASTESYRRFGFAGLARVQAEREEYEAALKTLSEEENVLGPLQSETEKASLSIDRAAIYCTLKAFDQCFQNIDQALRRDSSPENLLLASSTIGQAKPSMSKAEVVRSLERLHAMQARLPSEEIGTIYSLARYRIRGEVYLAEGDPKKALLEFRKADALDAPLRARDYLARGLVALASREHNSAVATQLREEARKVYARVALRPVIAWRRPFDYPPGFVVSEMRNFVELSRTLHHTDAEVQNVEAVMAGLRNASSSSTYPSAAIPNAVVKGASPQARFK